MSSFDEYELINNFVVIVCRDLFERHVSRIQELDFGDAVVLIPGCCCETLLFPKRLYVFFAAL